MQTHITLHITVTDCGVYGIIHNVFKDGKQLNVLQTQEAVIQAINQLLSNAGH